MTWWTSSVKLPFFNGLIGAPADDTAIDDLLERFAGRPVLWVILPEDDIAEALEERGFVVESMPGMAVALDTVSPWDIPTGVEVAAVNDDYGLLEIATEIAFTTNGFPPAAVLPMLGTLPEFRRRGLGTLVSRAALEAGRERGCTMGVLQASEQAVGVYRAIGFEECCRLAFAVRG